jgi:hypothetical protein
MTLALVPDETFFFLTNTMYIVRLTAIIPENSIKEEIVVFATV